MLFLEEDWDNNGAIKIDERTWSAMANFLITYAKTILYNYEVAIATPDINAGVDGSIDLCWKLKNIRLLINIKPFGCDIFANYYGDWYENKQNIKGPILNDEIEIIEHLAFWMRKLV
jgi:hypothetical protein